MREHLLVRTENLRAVYLPPRGLIEIVRHNKSYLLDDIATWIGSFSYMMGSNYVTFSFYGHGAMDVDYDSFIVLTDDGFKPVRRQDLTNHGLYWPGRPR